LLLRRGSVARALGVSRSVVGFTGAMKRLGDLALVAFGLLVLAPVMVCIGLLIKLEDGGPVIFRQARIGLNGKLFPMLKFRTVVVDPKDRNMAPRVTRFGQFLRALSLDELPQLFNVLTGSMSLVGPRAQLMRESAPDATEEVSVRPGLTGLWQISEHSNEDAGRLDLEYAKRWSLWLDPTPRFGSNPTPATSQNRPLTRRNI
jgi:lipopolysaccharide/colanic/teichoic acid biosynthesis glycosyltransferase